MSKKKPLSFAEKREKVLQIFHGNKEFYQLKDIEKIATSQKGVVEKSVKEVLISLVDDDLVDSAKIAQSTYYWSFPSNVKVQKKEKYLAMQTELKEVQIKLTNAEDNLEKLKPKTTGVVESERLHALNKLDMLKAKEVELGKQLAENQDLDIIGKKNESTKLYEAANRWTDNVFTSKSWCKNKFNMEEKFLNKQFKIPEDLNYL